MTANLLIELFVEELPPKALKKLGESFGNELFRGLEEHDFLETDSKLTIFATPRRLAARITNVMAVSKDKVRKTKLMPAAVGIDANGLPTQSLIKKLIGTFGYHDEVNFESIIKERVTKEIEDNKEILYHTDIAAGTHLAIRLEFAILNAIENLPIPKVMTYQLDDGWTSVNFVRPAHGLVVLHGDTPLKNIRVLGLESGNMTQGHRFEGSPLPIEISSADSYEKQLKDSGAVIASFAERRAEIVRQLNAAAAKENLTPIQDDALLDEVTALVERPNVLLGQFEQEYLEVPQECLILTMKANQKYFPLLDASGKLTNKFLIVSNINPADPSAVIGGNERVVRPRLADAKFFFDQDRKKTLESRIAGLDKVVYHNKLGSQGERNARVVKIAAEIVNQLAANDQTTDLELGRKVNKAASLSKTDLLTDMVGEFPELQGIMGRYYAQNEGLNNDVAFAIEDHYKPRFAGDVLPRNQVGICVALADKLETLVGMFGIGNVPTGDKDPFALRRHALGIVRMLAESGLHFDIDSILKSAISVFPEGVLQLVFNEGNGILPLSLKLHFFMLERTTGYLKDLGYSTQEAEAVVYLAQPNEYVTRLEAIRKARSVFPSEFAQLANADKRARNIINKSGESSDVLLTDNEKLVEDAEKVLLAKTRELRAQVNSLATDSQFEAALLLTVQISQPVTAFFESVMVNAVEPELRLNRFRLLHEVVGLTNCVANLSKLAS